MTEPIQIISLGAGIQSSALDRLSRKRALGLNPTASIFADTMDEPRTTYAWLEFLKQASGHPIITVFKGDLMKDALCIKRSNSSGKLYVKGLIPAYVKNEDGTKGLLGRKCTADYKIAPIVSRCRVMVGNAMFKIWRKNHCRALKALREWKKDKTNNDYPYWAWQECQGDPLVRMIIGISYDEADRMKPSREPWIRSEWPLVENKLTRTDCSKIVKQETGKDAPRSACKKCPFHSDEEWLIQKTNAPDEFAETSKWESDLQCAARNQEVLRGIPFLHESLFPIGSVEFRPQGPSHTQLNLFGNECEGLCGV